MIDDQFMPSEKDYEDMTSLQAALEKCIEERKKWCQKAMEAANDRLTWQNRATEANKEIERLKKCLFEYGEWARGNGERFRGNLQMNNAELYNQFLKEREQWKNVNSSF